MTDNFVISVSALQIFKSKLSLGSSLLGIALAFFLIPDLLVVNNESIAYLVVFISISIIFGMDIISVFTHIKTFGNVYDFVEEKLVFPRSKSALQLPYKNIFHASPRNSSLQIYFFDGLNNQQITLPMTKEDSREILDYLIKKNSRLPNENFSLWPFFRRNFSVQVLLLIGLVSLVSIFVYALLNKLIVLGLLSFDLKQWFYLFFLCPFFLFIVSVVIVGTIYIKMIKDYRF